MLIRPSARRIAAPLGLDGYSALLRAAEANPEEFFAIPGDKLALLLRELGPHRPVPKRPPSQVS